MLRIWLVFQLILCGIAAVGVHNEIATNKYDCTNHEVAPPLLGVIVPLAAFMPDGEIQRYCANK